MFQQMTEKSKEMNRLLLQETSRELYQCSKQVLLSLAERVFLKMVFLCQIVLWVLA